MKRDPRTKPYILLLLSNLATGCLTITANTSVDPIMNEFGWNYGRAAQLISFMAIGNLVTAAFGNLIAEKIGRRISLFLCALAGLAGYLLIALLPSPDLYGLLFFAGGCAWGGINNLINVVISEMYDGNAGRLNMGHACYAIGAVTMPLVISLVLNMGRSWRIPFAIVSALYLIALIGSLLIALPESPRKTGAQKQTGSLALMKESGFWLFLIAFFVYVGTESAASAWLSSYLKLRNPFFENIPAQTMVSLMWLMLLAGRLFFAAVGSRIDRRKLLLGLNLGFLAGMIGLVLFAQYTWTAILFTVIMGLGMSATYATIVSNAQRYVTGSAIVSGLILSAGGLGSAAIPEVAGLIGDQWGLRAGMASLCGFLLLMVAAAVINLRRKQA